MSAALHTLRLVALIGLNTTQKDFFTCLGSCNSLKQETCMHLLSSENTPLLIKSAILQISVCMYDMSVPAIINTMLLDMNNIQTQLTVRTANNSNPNINSRIPLGVKIPKGLQIAESPLNSIKIYGSTELSFCLNTCAEHLFEGILGTLSKILFTAFPCISSSSIAKEFNRIQQLSKSWQLLEKEKRNKRRLNSSNNGSCGIDDNDISDYGNNNNDNNSYNDINNSNDMNNNDNNIDIDNNHLSFGRLDKRALSMSMSGKSSISRKSSYSAEGDNGNGKGRTVGGNLKNNSSQIRGKNNSNNKNNNSNINDDNNNSSSNINNKNTNNNNNSNDSYDNNKVSFNGNKNDNDKKPIPNKNLNTKNDNDNKNKDQNKNNNDDNNNNNNNNKNNLDNNLSMENRIQLVECVIILFDTLMTENGNLFHCTSYSSTSSKPGNFNLCQCGKLLDLCIGVNLMLKIPKTTFLVPERAEKVGDILKLLIQHLYELKLRYSVLEDDMDCIRILCKTALSTSISSVLKSRLTNSNDFEKDKVADNDENPRKNGNDDNNNNNNIYNDNNNDDNNDSNNHNNNYNSDDYNNDNNNNSSNNNINYDRWRTMQCYAQSHERTCRDRKGGYSPSIN